jgi:hypothetical protein
MLTLLRVRRVARAFGARRSSTALPARFEERAPGSLLFLSLVGEAAILHAEPPWSLARSTNATGELRRGALGPASRPSAALC